MDGHRRRAVLATGVGLVSAGCLHRLVGSRSGEADDHPSDEGERADDDPVDGLDDESVAPDEWTPAGGSPLDASVTATTVVEGLPVPWDLAFADEDAFLTLRPGEVRRVDAAALVDGRGLSLADTDRVLGREDLRGHTPSEDGGTKGLAVHPDYPQPPHLFVFYTAETDAADGDARNGDGGGGNAGDRRGGLANRVVRYDLETGDLETVVDGIPGATTHNGGRVAFGPDGFLWVTTGDALDPALARDPSSLAGSVLRVTADGEPAPGNPERDPRDPRVYTVGHRNPQGIAFAPDGTALLSEHGPEGRDEVQVVAAGADYGWDLARGGPDDPTYDAYGDHPGFAPPVVDTGPETTWAPAGTAFYDDDAIPAWENRLFVAGLYGEALYAVTLVRDDADGGGPPPDGVGVRYDQPWLDDSFEATVHPLFVRLIPYPALRNAQRVSLPPIRFPHSGSTNLPFKKRKRALARVLRGILRSVQVTSRRCSIHHRRWCRYPGFLPSRSSCR